MNRIWLVAALLLLCPTSAAFGNIWRQIDWQGGDGQQAWSDTSKYYDAWSEDGVSVPGYLKLRYPGWECKETMGAPHVGPLVQRHDGSILVGTFYNADIFKSTDDGETWINIGSIPNMECPSDMVETPDSTLFANRMREIYQSKDGASWFPTAELPPEVGVTYCLLAYDTIMYVGAHTGSGHLYKTTDKGLTWESVGGLPFSIWHPYDLFKDMDGTIWTGGCCGGEVAWTTDQGFTWDTKGEVGWAYDFSQILDDTVYFSTYLYGGNVWRAVNHEIWDDLGELSGLEQANALVVASDHSIYVGGCARPNSAPYVYRTTNEGATWMKTGDICRDDKGYIHKFIETVDGSILASGSDGERGCVFKLSVPRGWVISSVYDAVGWPEYGIVSYSCFDDSGSVVVKIRTDTSPDMSGAPDWDLCPVAINGQDISGLSSVDDGERYIQYRVDMVGWEHDFFRTPVFDEISIEFAQTGVGEESDRWPEAVDFRLLQNEPNPFFGFTVVRYSLPRACAVNLSVYDVGGRLAETLVDEYQEPGFHEARWDGGRSTSGVYFCRLTAGDFRGLKKVMLVR
jgi:hypothetical protein